MGNEPFAVLFGDELIDSSCEPCIKQLMNAYELLGHTLLALRETSENKLESTGMISGEKNEDNYYEVDSIEVGSNTEETVNYLSMVGRYILRPEIFDYIEVIHDHSPEHVPLNEALNMLAYDQRVYGVCFKGKYYDIGIKTGYVQATLDFALKRDEKKTSILELMSNVVNKDRPSNK